MPGPMPAFNAMLICDMVIRDSATGEHSLIGVFDRILASSLPARPPSLAVYAKITDAQGRYVFRLELVDLNKGQTIGEGKTPEIEIPDRMLPHELVFNLQGLVFHTEARYEFRLYADDQFVGVHSFDVRVIPSVEGTP